MKADAILPYSFPDARLLVPGVRPPQVLAWVPPFEAVVLGCGSQADSAVDFEACLQDKVPVYRRPTGGESMFLSPKMVVISLLIRRGEHGQRKACIRRTAGPFQKNRLRHVTRRHWRKRAVGLFLPGRFPSRAIFEMTGRKIIQALESLGVSGLQVRGTSDLTLGDKKILGSAIYQQKGRVFFHAVINVSEDPDRIQRYLRHPAREPEYRQGRAHEDFVTSLRQAGYMVAPEGLEYVLKKTFAPI